MAGKVSPIEPGKAPRALANRAVTSVERSDLFTARQWERYNPDLLAQRKGGLGIYARMMTDEQVRAVVQFKRLSIIGRGYQFAFDQTDLPEEEQLARIRVMDQITRRMSGSFHDALLGILRGMFFGYSLTEIVTDLVKIDGVTYAGINKLLPRDTSSFQFYTDLYGNLERFTQKVGAREVELDYRKFIHYVHSPEDDPYYGRSELVAAYRPWFLKDTTVKFWAQWLERMAGGFAAINLGDSGITTNHPDYAALQAMLTNLRGTMGALLPQGTTMELVTPPTTDAYEKAVQFHDLAIAKALLIPNLLGLSNAGQTGAYAQSQTQLEVYFMTVAADSARLEQVLNDQLFAVLARENWDDGEFPRFRFKSASVEHTKWIVDSFNALAASGVVIPTERDEQYLRNLLTVPERQEDEEALAKVKQDMVPIQVDPNKAQPGDGEDDDEPPSQQFTAQIGVDAATVKQMIEDAIRAAAKPAEQPAPVQPAKTFSAKDRAVMRVDFSVIAQRATSLEADSAQQAARLAARAVRRLLTAERLPELLDKETQDIGEIKFDSTDIGKLKAAFRATLERAWSMGLMQAMDETGKARKQAYADDARKVRFAALRDKASEYFDAQAFRMAGNLTDGMRAIIQQELLKGVRNGTRPEEVAASAYERLIRKGMTTLEALEMEESRDDIRELTVSLLQDAVATANAPAYLNTLARTNVFEAMNEARYAEFTDPALGDFVQALEFSAILDDRTTEICSAMDGHVHNAGSAVWDKYRPPLHYNCRSVLVAITAADGWDGQESEQPTVEPQDGF